MSLMDKFELQKLRELPIEAVAERLGLQVSRHKCLCPFHADNHPSLSFRVSKNTYRCFVCGASGDNISLVEKVLGKSFPDACRWLQNEQTTQTLPPAPPYMEGSGQTCNGTQKEPSLLCTFDASRYVRYFERPWLNEEARKFLFDERRLDERVVRWCRLTSWKDRMGVPWLQIPYYDREGRLVGVQNRNLTPSNSPEGGESHAAQLTPPSSPSCASSSSPSGRSGGVPRFRFPQGSECGIYNLPVLNLLKPGEQLFITEGCSDCWAMLSAGHKAIAIPSATLLTKKDKELLRSLSDSKLPASREGLGVGPFHMFPDRDAPGERLFLQLQQVLPSLVHHQLPPDCKDFSDYYLKELSAQPLT